MKTFKLTDNIDSQERVRIYKHLHTTPEAPHRHEFFEIVYVYSGCGRQIINGKSFFVKHGDLLVLDLKDEHSFVPETSLGIMNCLIDTSFLNENLSNSFSAMDILSLTSFNQFNLEEITPVIKFSNSSYYEIENIFESMEKEFSCKQHGFKTIIHSYIDILLAKIFRELELRDNLSLKENISKIAPVILKYIEDNYNSKITLEDLANKSFYAPSYFSKIFKESMGKTLSSFITELRINNAIKDLIESDLSIEAIAYKTGYSDKKNFYSTFKKLTGKTPQTFRKNLQNKKTTS